MKRKAIAIAVLAIAASPAWACGNKCHPQPPKDQPPAANASANAGAIAGAVAGAQANNHNRNDNNNANLNANHNSNRNNNEQGQAQGQIAVGRGGKGGAGGAGGNAASDSSSTSNSGGNTMMGGANTASQANSVTVTGDTVTYEAQKRNPVSTAYAAPLAASTGTCLGSASGGVQATGVGLSFGTTTLDDGCDARFDASALNALGLRMAAVARLCQRDGNRDAIEAAGGKCPGNEKQASAQASAKATAQASAQASIVYAN